MEHWYTVYTKPNHEYRVSTALAQKGLATYLPELTWQGNSGKQDRTGPYFPCYLFLRADLKRDSIATFRWIPGLKRILSFDNQPVPIEDDLIDLLRTRLSPQPKSKLPAPAPLTPGDEFRITTGPFQDMIAILESQPVPASQRVEVLLKVMGCRYQIDLSFLNKTDTDHAPLQPQANKGHRRKRRTRGRGRVIKPKASST